MNAKELLRFFFFPFAFYILVAFDFPLIPEIKKEHIYYFVCTVLLLIYLFNLLKGWRIFVTTKKKIITSIFIAAFFLIHIILLFVVTIVANKHLFANRIIQVKSKSFEPTIYIVKNVGFLNSYESAEIGYSPGLSPFYTRYYRTKNHLKLIQEDSSQVIIEEFMYERPPSNKGIFVPRDEVKVRTIRLDREKLK